MKRKKILYVEDNAINAMVIELMLKGKYDIDTAESPDIARASVLEYDYDLILMDINLGNEEVDGIGLSHEIWNLPAYKETKIILVTATAPYEQKDQYIQNGFFDFLTKPVDKEKLYSTIESAFGTPLPV